RFQPEGPHGPSEVVDPRAFRWSDGGWRGVGAEGQVLYEMHVGTFTPEGTWAAAAEQLPELAALGVTAIEMLPVHDFAGSFGWGYDGVDLFAPTRLYGTPDDLRRFVDRAHGCGIGVILDVVYNHCGAADCYLKAFSEDYFTDRYENEWGDAINFDGENAEQVREFILANAAYWIDEFHVDGLRIDAAQQMFDASGRHILAELGERARAAAGGRKVLLVAENEPQQARMVRPESEGGYGLDLIWNEDFHHCAVVAVGGRREAYYSDHRGRPQELISAAKYGFLFQGQFYAWQGKGRGTPALDLAPHRFVNYLQNHDQVANTGFGVRLHALTSPGRYRAITALLLLGPGTPLLFQGQEFAASTPFRYFNDAPPALADALRSGRADFVSQFASLAAPGVRERLPDPIDPETFRACKLDFADRERHAGTLELYRDLLRLRREDPVFSRPRRGGVDGAVLGDEAFALRFFAEQGGDDRLLLVNLGPDLPLSPIPEPLLAPVEGRPWRTLWSSEDLRYGGGGMAPLGGEGASWCLAAHAAVVLAP
ncbi:MAG TPA: alpha-amylase family glycosyl hydrolase, partial [Geminicoccaceae bacterium]|nr:alpha-amylase family glycosyl hydrolase [Geminicoccaceae bacterium]